METNNFFPQKSNMIEIDRFLHVLRSWAWLIALTAIVMGGIAFIYSRASKPVYTATSLLVASGYSSSGSYNYDAVATGEKLAISYAHMMSRTEMINQALSQVGGGLNYEGMKDNIVITPLQNSQLVEINVQYKDPVVAAKIANTIVDVFVQRLKSDYAASSTATRDNLQARITELSQQIASLQDDIKQKYASNHDERLKEVNSAIVELQQKIGQLSDEVTRLQFNTPVIAKDLYGRTILATPTPRVEDQSAIAVKNAQLEQWKDLLRQYQQQYVLLSTNADTASSSDPTISQAQTNLNQLQGQYFSLQQNLVTIQPNNSQNPSNLIQIYKADVPKEPKGSKVFIYTALGLLIGILLSTGGIYALLLIDPHLMDPGLIPQRYDLPVLGAHFKGSGSGKTLIKQQRSTSQIYETCRLLRIKIFEKEGTDSILLTGPTQGDDSGSLAANLAVVMAESGTRTLLLDMNMYQSAVPGLFEKVNPKGLGDLLSGSVKTVDQVVSATEFPCLSLIRAGGLTPANINQFNAQIGKDLIQDLKERYGFVIINTPPVLSTNDTLMLVPFAKSVILAINPEKSTLADMDQCIKKLSSVNASIMGIVLNNMTSRWYRLFYKMPYSGKVFGK